MPATSPPLLTVGHGTADARTLVGLLTGAGVGLVVDVRRYPGSARHPHVAREAMAGWLAAAGLGYRWDPRLGGRRRVPSPGTAAPAGTPVPDGWWQVEAFRAYAAHTRSEEFGAAMTDLLADVRREDHGATVVLCSESLWWRCHRRLIGDVAVLLHGVPVEHLGHDHRRTAHRPAEGARVTPAGLRYEVEPVDATVASAAEDRPTSPRDPAPSPPPGTTAPP